MNESDIIIESDLLIRTGDIVVKNANEQTIKHLLISRGNYLLNPTIGVGIYNMQNSTVQDYRDIANTVKQELTRDGFTDVSVGGQRNDFDKSTKLNITATRISIPKRATI